MVSEYIRGGVALVVLIYFWICVFRYWRTTPPDDPGARETFPVEEWKEAA